MKVIHLGPFSGNIGDVFSYVAFQENFKEIISDDVEFTNINIRDFYNNVKKRKFDKKFADFVNKFDLFIIGGGQYFDVRWDYSHTGTTLDMSEEFLEQIKVKTIICSIGYSEIDERIAEYQQKQDNYLKFQRFLTYILEKKKWLVAVRNDGSYQRIRDRYGKKIAEAIHMVPDNGFFFNKNVPDYEFDENKTTIGISVSNDMFVKDKNVDIDNFNKAITKVISELISTKNYRIVFFIHAPQDLTVVAKILDKMNDLDVRNNIVISPYNTQGKRAAETIVSYYKACDLCISMRLHSNIISIQNGIPTIGLSVNNIVSNKRIISLYRDLHLEKYLLEVDSQECNLSEKLIGKIDNMFDEVSECTMAIQAAMIKVEHDKLEYFSKIKAILGMV